MHKSSTPTTTESCRTHAYACPTMKAPKVNTRASAPWRTGRRRHSLMNPVFFCNMRTASVCIILAKSCRMHCERKASWCSVVLRVAFGPFGCFLQDIYSPSWQQNFLMTVEAFSRIDFPCKQQKLLRNALRNTL